MYSMHWFSPHQGCGRVRNGWLTWMNVTFSNMIYHNNSVLPLSTAFTTVPIIVLVHGDFELLSVNVFVWAGLMECRLFGNCHRNTQK